MYMAKSYRDVFDELLTEAKSRVEGNPHLHWDEAAREAVEEYVLRMYDTETLENILNNSRPNDEWQIHCSDMGILSRFEKQWRSRLFEQTL